MSDTSTTATDGTGDGAGDASTTTSSSSAERTFTQADLDRIIADRLRRENVAELRTKATELDNLKQSTKTAEQQNAERLAELERRLNESETGRLRLRVAARYKLTDEDADLFLTGADEETLERQAKALTERTKAAQTSGAHVPGEGRTPTKTPGDDSMREFARQLFAKPGAA